MVSSCPACANANIIRTCELFSGKLIDECKPYKKEWMLAILSMIAVAFFTSQLTLLVKSILDDVLIQTKPEALARVSVLLLVFYLGKGIFSFTSSYLMTSIGLHVVRNLRNRLYRHIIFQSLSFFSSEKTGDLTVSSHQRHGPNPGCGIENLHRPGKRNLHPRWPCIRDLLYRLEAGVDFDCAVSPGGLSHHPVFPTVAPRKPRAQENISSLSQILFETISSSRIVQAYRMEERETARFDEESQKLLQEGLHASRVVSFSSPFMEMLSGIAAVLVMWYGSHQIARGALTAGDFTAFLTALFFMYTPVKKLSKANQTIQQAVASYSRIESIFSRKEQIDKNAGAVAVAAPEPCA